MVSRRFARAAFAAVLASLFPTVSFAQSAIAGFVTDATGGVLPGVTIEAASPALIEKVRTALSDGNGRYRIEDLRPGTYKVTFTLTGFSTFVREDVVLETNFTASINAQLRVGTLDRGPARSVRRPGELLAIRIDAPIAGAPFDNPTR